MFLGQKYEFFLLNIFEMYFFKLLCKNENYFLILQTYKLLLYIQ
jgi:hypothetical protein